MMHTGGDEMNIEYVIRSKYGSDKRYPVNSWGEFICELAGTRTITDAMLSICEYAGIETEEVDPRYTTAGR